MRTPPVIRLRPATAQDIDILFRLRTEPLTAWASVSPPPTYPEHLAWLLATLATPHRHLYIAEAGEYPGFWVGTARLDQLASSAAEVSLTVWVAHRGRGVGQAMLRAVEVEAQALGVTRLVASIKAENTASQRCFYGAGYAWDGPLRYSKRLSVAVPALPTADA